MSAKHKFALFYQGTPSFKNGSTAQINDLALVRRMAQVLRVREGSELILFDAHKHAIVRIESISKAAITCMIRAIANNTVLRPNITMMLPVLKKDALSHAVYSCVELGVTTIQLVNTQKVQRAWGGDKEFQRLHKVIIAAAEQAKQFVLPDLKAPIPLSDALAQAQGLSIFADPDGDPLLDVLQKMNNSKPSYISLFVGPEGDFTDQEKKQLTQAGTTFCALTPTVLRARQACGLLIGAVRSVAF